MLFDHPDFDAHEQVMFAADPATGLQAILAVHDTTLGPALGGCRITRYPADADALTDALRLSRGMTYKAALADLPLGGGKSVVLADAATEKTPEMMRAMGVAVERLGGRYIVAEDVGATPEDMARIGEATAHVSGRATDVGDPSPWTAKGVFLCLEAAAKRRFKRADLAGLRVGVKGLGAVGGKLAAMLAEAGAALVVADVRAEATAAAAETLGAEVAAVDEIAAMALDVYAPCALGAEFDAAATDALQAELVCGAANNQLATDADGARLARKGVLYCPDYLVNAGGLISVARPALGMADAAAEAKLAALPQTLAAVLDAAAAEDAPTAAVADRMAEARFRPAGRR